MEEKRNDLLLWEDYIKYQLKRNSGLFVEILMFEDRTHEKSLKLATISKIDLLNVIKHAFDKMNKPYQVLTRTYGDSERSYYIIISQMQNTW